MLQQLTEDRRRADERYDSASVRSALEIDRLRQELKAERHQRSVTETELKGSLEEALQTQQRLKSEQEQINATHVSAQVAWQQERLAVQEQIERLEADLLAREGLLNEQRALLPLVPVSTEIGSGDRPAAVEQVLVKAPPKPKAKRSAARPPGAWRLRRAG